MSIEAKAELRRKPVVSTGIDELDSLLGGIPAGSVILVEGSPGSGFEIFAQQVLYSKSNKSGAQVAYYTVERPVEDLESEMAFRGWEIQSLIANKRWEFIDGYTSRMEIKKGVLGPKVLLDLLNTSMSASIKNGRWTALDTLSYFLQNYDPREVSSILENLLPSARDAGGLHFLLALRGLHNSEIILPLSHFFDGHFVFSLRKEETEPIGNLRIRKLRMADHVVRSIPYRITEKGISIETSIRIA